jgi:hypothetical protein
MLKITIPAVEEWDEARQEFISTKETELRLEHSLVSVSKWESKWHKHFIGNKDLTPEMLIDYIRCMTLTQNVDPEVYYAMNDEIITQIKNYIDDAQTATWFAESNEKKYSRDIITSEIIYYWMIALQIPFECQKWHLNRLLTLIRVCNEKNQPEKKMSQAEVMRRNREINEARRRALNTRG